MSDISIKIDGKSCKAKEGETVLNIARRNNIFIPAICYLNGCSPTLACRLCLVDIDGKRAYSCNAKAKDGMEVITNSEEITQERKAIMQVYDINHPLECGVCDQSGECELQNYTLEMEVESQHYCIADTHRPTQDWGLIHYDPSLCILCERCITVSKDMIGDNALKTVPRGGDKLDKEWKDKMPKDSYATWNKLQKSIIGRTKEIDPQEESGECVAVCPVGALVTKDFQYTSNAWELRKIPASNPHSSDCSLIYYDVKHSSIDDCQPKIYRVSSEYSFAPLNGAARFGYDFQNEVEGKDEKAFLNVVSTFQNGTIKQIEFSSFITNEEALILQKLKEKFSLKLVNEEAKRYQRFLSAFSKTSGTSLYNGNINEIKKSNFLISVGTFLRSDSPNVSYAFNNALTMNKGAGFYFHPLGDKVVEGFSKNIKTVPHKPGVEEGILYLLLDKFGDKKSMNSDLRNLLNSLHVKKEKEVSENVKEKVTEIIKDENGDEKEVSKMVTKKVTKVVEFESNKLYEMMQIDDLEDDFANFLAKKDKFSLIVGEDLYRSENWEKLAKLLGLIQKYTPFNVTIIPTNTNTLGVSLICDLDEKEEGAFTLGYNVKGDLTLSALGGGDLDMPALNQQEGTFTNLNKRVVPTNVAIGFNGYCLNDIANALGLHVKYTIDYTEMLPIEKGYKKEKFDNLPNHFDNGGVEHRGYMLDIFDFESEEFSEDLHVKSLQGDLVYLANPINQFSPFTNKAHLLQTTAMLHVSEDYLKKHKLQDGCMVKISNEKDDKIALKVKVNDNLKGEIPYLPNFDTKVDVSMFFKNGRYASLRVEEIK